LLLFLRAISERKKDNNDTIEDISYIGDVPNEHLVGIEFFSCVSSYDEIFLSALARY
jgi:hypothetical protein